MNRYFDAQGGLKKLFAGTVGTLICNVVSAIPFLVMVAAVGSLLFTALAIYGLYQAGKDIPGCKSAFLLYVIEFVVQIFSSAFAFMPMGAAIASICVIAQAILDMVIIYLVCTLPCSSTHATRTRTGPAHSVPIRACSGWGLPSRRVATTLVVSYTTVSAFPFTPCGAGGSLLFCGAFRRITPPGR